MQFLWQILARILTCSPRLVTWIIMRAQRTPYTNIPSRDGRGTYMERWWVFNPYGKDAEGNELPARWSWLPSVRIHHICLPDGDRDLHDHPWNARTIVLRGFYVETQEHPHASNYSSGRLLSLVCPTVSHIRSTGYTGRLLFGQYHRIERVSEGGVWTLFFTWKYRGTWGFKVNGKKVPWRTYLGLEELKVQRGQVLALVGPEGSGKSTKARELAAKAGTFVEISSEDLASQFQMGNALASEPATVIVEVDRPLNQRAQVELKKLLTNTHTICERKMRHPISVRTPNFIFCAQSRDFLPSEGRRFHVVELPAPHHPV
jgi:hypothetical protein